jgi:hypothetical protein
MRKLKRPEHFVAVNVREISSTLEYQAGPINVLGFMDISLTDRVTLLVAHVKLYSIH